MLEFKLSAETRTALTKRDTKKLRLEGKIPSVYYYHAENPIPLCIDVKELKTALHSGAHIISLQIGGKSHPCIVRALQHDPVSEMVIHADFMGVNLEEKIVVSIPVKLVGTAIGVKTFGGILAQHLWELDVKCKAADIPDGVTIDVSELNLGDSIGVKDIQIANAEIQNVISASIVSVVKPSGVSDEEKPAEGEETAEGEEAAAEGEETKEEGKEEKTKKKKE